MKRPSATRRLARAIPGALRRRALELRGGRPDPLDNVGYNRRLWDWYADRWREDPGFRRDEADVEDESRQGKRFSVLGDEWGTAADVERVMADYIDPFVDASSVAGEIGAGGGRIASRVVEKVGELYCFDISERMLERARERLGERREVRFVLLDGPRLPRGLDARFDFLYAFDVFVHLDLHTIWKYLNEISRGLQPGGHTFLHTTNLTAPAGWESFAKQDRYRPETHYFVSPEIVRSLVAHTDLRYVKESEPRPDSFYLNRDYLFVLEKPA